MEPVQSVRAPRILVVDDQADHAMLVRKALEQQDPVPEVIVVHDGASVLETIHRELPDLVLLDLNMPGMSGQEVLAAIRADAEVHRIPVSILSTSSHRDDVRACFDLHANAYIQKPESFRALLETMKTVTEHWFSASIVPSSPDGP